MRHSAISPRLALKASMLVRRAGALWRRRAKRIVLAVIAALVLWQALLITFIVRHSQTGLSVAHLSHTPLKGRQTLLVIDPAVATAPHAVRAKHAPGNAPNSHMMIHQIWRSGNLTDYPFALARTIVARWRALGKRTGLAYRLWTDADIAALLSDTASPYAFFAAAYEALPVGVMRADAARLVLLHAHGGIYADLDTQPLELAHRLPTMLLADGGGILVGHRSGFDCVLPMAQTHLQWSDGDGAGGGTHTITNHWMACRRGSAFLLSALRLLAQRIAQRWWRRVWILPFLDVLQAAGPLFLTDALQAYAEDGASGGVRVNTVSKSGKMLSLHPPVALLSFDEQQQYVNHAIGRSWHGLDGRIIMAVSP